jgi:hypothetical protein
MPEGQRALWLREDRPMSYLRVSAAGGDKRPGPSFAKTAIESTNAPLPRRYAVVFSALGVESELVCLFDEAVIPGLFAAFPIEDDPGCTLTLLSRQQLLLLAESTRLRTARAPAHIRDSRITVELVVDPWDLPGDLHNDDGFRYQYRFGIAHMDDAPATSLVWPNGARGGSDASDYLAVMSPEHLRDLGDPRYVVIENPVDPGKYAYALAKCDDSWRFKCAAHSNPLIKGGHAANVVALDRGVREVLGIGDGELAIVHRWGGAHLRLSFDRWAFATRSVYAHPSPPLRGDLEKPVCRLSKDVMSAIGVREGDQVQVGTVVRVDSASGDDATPSTPEFKHRTITRRALLIDEVEAKARRGWSSADAEEDYIDCAELHGVFPPYPIVYLDYFALAELFAGGHHGRPLVCPVVQVRPKLLTRLADEVSELAWVGIAAIVALVARAFDYPVVGLSVLALALLVALVYARVRRATR